VSDRGFIRSQGAILKREKDMKRNILIATVAAGIAALAPTMAAASPHDLPLGTGATTSQRSTHVRPDDRAGLRGAFEGTVGSSVAVRPDDRAGLHGPGTPPPSSLVRSSDGFDWQDAFVGGLGGVGIALLLTGLLFLVTSRRTRTRIA
jgi:hypothetical protein